MGDEIRVVGISTSPRKAGNTERLVKTALLASEQFGKEVDFTVKTELICLAGKKILPCFSEYLCVTQNCYCPMEDDFLDLVSKLVNPIPNGLIIGSPVYFFNINSLGQAFLERCTTFLQKIWTPDFPYEPPDFSQTAAGAVAVGLDRNGGVEHTISAIIHWLLIMGFVTVGGFYIGGGGWAQGSVSRKAIEKDVIGLRSAELVGKKVVKTAILLKQGAAAVKKEFPSIPHAVEYESI